MSLDVQIKVETGQAAQSADKVEKSLADVEKQGEQASRAMRSLASSFASLNQVMQARARSSQLHAQLNNSLASSFAGVAAAMQREKSMLVSIRGDMDAYQRDVQTLDALMKRGAITANEYAASLARSRRSAGLGDPMAAVSLEMPGKAKPGQSLGTTMMRGAMAGTAVIGGLGAAASLGDEYTNLRNRMRQVATGQDELNRLMERMGEVANNTRSDIGSTGEAFVRLMQATKHMGVSQERGIKITETLNMALQSSGASASEASAGTLQLMQAMAAGALQGDEFRSIAENMPQLLDVFAKQLGVTRGEVKKMGSEGKITTDIMIKALEAFGPQAKKTFEESEETFGQFTTRMRNHVVEFFGSSINPIKAHADAVKRANVEWIEAAAAAEDAAESTRKFADTMGLGREVGDAWTKTTEALTIKTQEFGDAEAQLVLTAMEHVNAGFAVSKMLAEQLTFMENLRKEVERLASIDPWGDPRTGWTKFRERIGDKIEFGIDAIEKRTKKFKDAVKEAAQETEKLAEAWSKFMSARSTYLPGSESPLAGEYARERYINDEIERLSQTPDLDLEADLRAHDGGKNPWEKRTPGYLTNMWNAELDSITQRNEQFRDDTKALFQDIGSSIAQSLFDGRMEWDRLLKSMTLGFVKLLAMQALRSQGMDTSLLGGIRLPGFATGGSFMVGGNGGTDTTPVAFMASPGERVTVETPGQQATESEVGARVINIHLGERDVLRALDTPDGEKLIVKVMRKANRAVKGHTTGT